MSFIIYGAKLGYTDFIDHLRFSSMGSLQRES